MNICIDIIKYSDDQSKEIQHLHLQPALNSSGLLEPEKSQDWIKRQRPKYVKNAWNKAEKKKYVNFLRKNKHLFNCTLIQRKKTKINVMMSKAIRTRTAAKCHSYHQKMMLKYVSIQNIIESHSELFLKKNTVETLSEVQSQEVQIQDKIQQFQVSGSEYLQYQKHEPYWMQFLDLSPLEQNLPLIKIQNQQQ